MTVPVQCLVQDSVLQLSPSSKANLLGFYDPCIDEPKARCRCHRAASHALQQLRIRYKCLGRLHEVTVADDDAAKLPMRAHLLPQ